MSDWPLLWNSLLVTLTTTFEALALALLGGVGLAVLFNQSRLIENCFYPYAVILQVTPVVAIAPLLLVYLPQYAAVLTCAWIVAFFPILANTTLGLNSVDRNLADLLRSMMPRALPCCCGSNCRRRSLTSWAGSKIAGGLALIGAVVAEIAAGSRGRRLRPCLPYRPNRVIASTSRACSRH